MIYKNPERISRFCFFCTENTCSRGKDSEYVRRFPERPPCLKGAVAARRLGDYAAKRHVAHWATNPSAPAGHLPLDKGGLGAAAPEQQKTYHIYCFDHHKNLSHIIVIFQIYAPFIPPFVLYLSVFVIFTVKRQKFVAICAFYYQKYPFTFRIYCATI